MEGQLRLPAATSVADIVRAHLPGFLVSSVVPIGEGVDNFAYVVNDELVVRFGKESQPARCAELISPEAELLAVVAQISPLRVPEPVFSDPRQGCLAYVKIPGEPLLHLPRWQRLEIAPAVCVTLGEFLAALHAAPADRMAGLVGRDEVPMAEWREEAMGNYSSVRTSIPAARRAAVETFLAASPPDSGPGTLVFSHNDLGIEHVLIDPEAGVVTGVIDWSDAAITDPAYDFGLIYRDLGPAALTAALRGYAAGDTGALRERAGFYARCSVLEDLAYGRRTGLSVYTDKNLAALDWLFAGRRDGDLACRQLMPNALAVRGSREVR